MTSEDLKQLAYDLMVADQTSSLYVQNLTEIITTSISTLATVEPEVALDLLDQLYKQRDLIEQGTKERVKRKADYMEANKDLILKIEQE